MNRRHAPVALVLAGLVLALAGCVNPKNPGEVVDRERGTRYEKDRICVRYDGGGTECGGVSEDIYDSCPVGSRWPACRTTPIP